MRALRASADWLSALLHCYEQESRQTGVLAVGRQQLLLSDVLSPDSLPLSAPVGH